MFSRLHRRPTASTKVGAGGLLLACWCLIPPADGFGQDRSDNAKAAVDDDKKPSGPDVGQDPRFEVSEDVKAVLVPLFSSILKADVSRATVKMTAETMMNGVVEETEEATYQIASRHPNQYTVYYKAADERKRVFCDGSSMVVAFAPDRYVTLDDVYTCQQTVDSQPVSLGPYPEPLLALTLAGVDPAFSLLSGMRSVRVVGTTKFRGRVDAVRLRGVQDDGVIWDLWMTRSERPRPLRLLVDLTPMLTATDQVNVPEGYGYSLRYDFTTWRVDGEIADSFFHYSPPEDAIRFDSVAQYEAQQANRSEQYSLLGQELPEYELRLLDGTAIPSSDLKGKIVVLDFWATWCEPCLEAIPTIAQACRKHPDKVVLVAVNVGEPVPLVRGYAKEQDWDVKIAVDPQAKLAEKLAAKKIPLTLVISAEGIVEAAHVGYPGDETLTDRFAKEFSVLMKEGRIASQGISDAESRKGSE